VALAEEKLYFSFSPEGLERILLDESEYIENIAHGWGAHLRPQVGDIVKRLLKDFNDTLFRSLSAGPEPISTFRAGDYVIGLEFGYAEFHIYITNESVVSVTRYVGFDRTNLWTFPLLQKGNIVLRLSPPAPEHQIQPQVDWDE
jgi:hypothetical protein